MKTENLDLPERIKRDYIDTGITELNPPQEKAVKSGLLDGEDMIVASPTASGKTFIAELAMVEKAVKENKTAVYVVPLKALASEKYEDFSERYEDLNVKISVGDLDDAGEYLENADIVIVTSEKLDSMLRHNPSWIHDIGLVVIDEIHLLTSKNRGPTLEVTLTRLRDLLEFQLLGLSATISNSGELAEWLDAELVESDYRPVELRHGIYQGNEIEYYSGDEEIDDSEEEDSKELSGWQTGKEAKQNNSSEGEKYFVDDKHGQPAPNLLEDTFQMDKQAIVFCSSRKGAEKSSDRAAKITEEKIDREEKQKLEEYADRILNVLGSPTSQCKRLAENVEKGAAFHHAGLVTQQRQLIEQAFKKDLIKSVSATPTLAAGVNLPAFRVIIRDLKRYDGNGMNWIPVLEYEQMTGRAGRPKYDDRGEAISVAKNSGSVDEIKERFVLGEPERIQSKLNVEPVLRMHTLALVASNFCTSMEGLLEFYQKTFYAHQFGDMQKVAEKIRDVVDSLRDYDFIREDEMKATKIGKKVSDLYIDPDSAHYMVKSLGKAEGTETRAISYLFMLSRTSEMAPRLRVKDKEWSDYQNALQDAEIYLLDSVPNEWEAGYESYLESMKTAMMMQSWVQEMDEERIMNEFGTAPGGIRAKMQNADWLLYGAKELVRMKETKNSESSSENQNSENFSGVEKDIEKLRVRMEHGIKDELLDLVQYDQIGRVRARKLHDHGIETQSQIREVNFEKLKKLIGKKTAKKLKKQVGQDNIFDREDITDWYD
ncbi:DEAD/DEAH box helicase [Candidatus Nanohalobium constans]|uniref:ATP-dependent DNA helicase Hel308 n=1 Tax=Candidatus Nanohalobium constans TaxID=2565781 RepID=A0A5Q0UFT6_9ARCH|nr:DEAD/DEAH box helicase [Candidatus Nanohalobium constans]QGA80060.1 superfamily II helicase [Candidatus Nanohalobium constans]